MTLTFLTEEKENMASSSKASQQLKEATGNAGFIDGTLRIQSFLRGSLFVTAHPTPSNGLVTYSANLFCWYCMGAASLKFRNDSDNSVWSESCQVSRGIVSNLVVCFRSSALGKQPHGG